MAKKKDITSRKTTSEKIVQGIAFVIMLLHCGAIIYVYLYGLNASLHVSHRHFNKFPNTICFYNDITKSFVFPNFQNYITAFNFLQDTNNFFYMLFNSTWYSIGGELFSLAVATCSTYIIAKYKNVFTKIVFNVCIFVMIFPVVGSAPSLYKFYQTLGIDQTPFILLSGLNNMCHLMIYAFFSALSWTYAEAAFIDGANDFQVFFKIMLPMALPSISVIFVSGVIGRWNDYATPLLYLDKAFPTLASGLLTFERLLEYNSKTPAYFAGVIMAMVPPIALFSVMQETIMSKVYFGGLKG